MRNVEVLFSIIKTIAERECVPIEHVLKNIAYYSDKYSMSIDKKEIINLKNTIKTKVRLDDFTKLKPDLFI